MDDRDMGITFESKEEYNAAKILIENNRPEIVVTYSEGKGERIAPDQTRPYTAYYDTEFALEADNHILQLLEIDLE